ncbi:hypothetical protein BDV93DRAFT_526657 [Ceratobasidium sp. AG-I]|nr:hypothetical protein BDV93DRAFT_526657 [Ceratobasidium sp. AG-I]
MNHLPAELVLHISECLHDKSLQLKLAALNSRTYQIVTPLVYKRVSISNSDKILAFRSSVANSSLSIHVKFLRLDLLCHWSGGRTPAVGHAIYDILDSLVNLGELELLGHAALFLCEHLSLNVLVPTRQLTRLKIMGCYGIGFISFLHYQPSIVSLELVKSCCGQRFPSTSSVAENRHSFLPALAELAADIPHIIEIVPGRRIHKVDVLSTHRTRSTELNGLIQAIGMSRVPVTSISFLNTSLVPHYSDHIGWAFIRLLSQSTVAASVHALVVDMRVQTEMNLRNAYPELTWEKVAQALAIFTSLESLQFEKERWYASYEWMSEVPRQIGSLIQLSSWKAFCQKLLHVKLFGKVLE